MAKKKTMQSWLNPLRFPEADSSLADERNHTIDLPDIVRTMCHPERKPTIDLSDIVRFLCHPGTNDDVTSILQRYYEISIEGNRLFAVPADEQILSKLIWPLKDAKVCYMLGNYLGTISLCGTVAEMMAILVFGINEMRVSGQAMDDRMQKCFLGATFEKLGQDRRVSVLVGCGLVTETGKKWFDDIRIIRRRYLHLYSQGQEDIAADARKAFGAAVDIVASALGVEFREGKMQINPAVELYLEKLGVVVCAPESPDESAKAGGEDSEE